MPYYYLRYTQDEELVVINDHCIQFHSDKREENQRVQALYHKSLRVHSDGSFIDKEVDPDDVCFEDETYYEATVLKFAETQRALLQLIKDGGRIKVQPKWLLSPPTTSGKKRAACVEEAQAKTRKNAKFTRKVDKSMLTQLKKCNYEKQLQEKDDDEDDDIQETLSTFPPSSDEEEGPADFQPASKTEKPLPRVIQLQMEKSRLEADLRLEKEKNKLLGNQIQLLGDQIKTLKKGEQRNEELIAELRLKEKRGEKTKWTGGNQVQTFSANDVQLDDNAVEFFHQAGILIKSPIVSEDSNSTSDATSAMRVGNPLDTSQINQPSNHDEIGLGNESSNDQLDAVDDPLETGDQEVQPQQDDVSSASSDATTSPSLVDQNQLTDLGEVLEIRGNFIHLGEKQWRPLRQWCIVQAKSKDTLFVKWLTRLILGEDTHKYRSSTKNVRGTATKPIFPKYCVNIVKNLLQTRTMKKYTNSPGAAEIVDTLMKESKYEDWMTEVSKEMEPKRQEYHKLKYQQKKTPSANNQN